MGVCANVCCNQGGVDLNYLEFFDSMKARKLRINEISTKFKIAYKKGRQAFTEKEVVPILEQDFIHDINGLKSEEYHSFFLDAFEESEDRNFFILSLLFLCSKDSSALKMNLVNFFRIFQYKKSIKTTQDEKYDFIEKEILEKLVIAVFSLYTFKPLKTIAEFMNYNPKLTKEIEESFSKNKVEIAAKKLVDSSRNPLHSLSSKKLTKEQLKFREDYCTGLNENKEEKDLILTDKNEEEFSLKNYIDFDYFIENTLDILYDHRLVRELVYNVNNTKNKSKK